MTTQSEIYEKGIHAILDSVAKSRNIAFNNLGVGRKNKIKGASGFMHQIDASGEYVSKDGAQRLWLGECKLRDESNSKIGISDILIFYARIADIQLLLGGNIIVEGHYYTTTSYTEPAKTFAEHYGIGTHNARFDFESWALQTKDETVIQPRLGILKTSAPSPSIKISDSLE